MGGGSYSGDVAQRTRSTSESIIRARSQRASASERRECHPDLNPKGKNRECVDNAEHLKTNYGLKSGPDPFLIDSGAIAYNSLTITDDRVTYLSFFGRVVATVMEVRTDLNNVQYTFFRNLDGVEGLVQRQNRVHNIDDE